MDIKQIPLTDIVPPVVQPRLPAVEDDQVWLEALQFSIRDRGFKQPIVVAWDEATGKYRIVHGERRWRAAKENGQQTVPCVVRDAYPDIVDFLADTVAENEARQGLKDEEVAWAMYVTYYVLNLQALARKHNATLGHLAEVDRQAWEIARQIDVLDDYDRYFARQRAVKEYLADELENALLDLGLNPNTWKAYVPWTAVQEKLGLSYLSKRDRLRALKLLDIAPDVAVDVAASGLSALAKRELANHPPEIQREIVGTARQSDDGLDGLTAQAIQGMAAQFDNDEDALVEVMDMTGSNGTASLFHDLPAQETAVDLPINGTAVSPQTDAGDGAATVTDDDLFQMHQVIEMLREVERLAANHADRWSEEGREMIHGLLVLLGQETGLMPIDPAYAETATIMLPAVTEWMETEAETMWEQLEEGVSPDEVLANVLNTGVTRGNMEI